jgi:hypothetical protein
MSEEMSPYFLGAMPPKDFLSAFLPSSKSSRFKRGIFDDLVSQKPETKMYNRFVSD